MVVAIAPWSLVVHPGKKISYDVIRDFKVTNAALGAKLEDEKARSTLKVIYEPPTPLSDSEEEDEEDEQPKKGSPKKAEKVEISLCSLTPGTIEQASLDITFLEDDLVEFEVAGKNSIHLFGNYVDQSPLPTDLPPDDFDDEESVDLRDVSSDVEIDPDELDGLEDSDDEDRFEEIDDEAPSAKKRTRDSDAMEEDVPTKSLEATKKPSKKLKSANGSAVPVSPADETKTDAKPQSKKEKKDKNKKKGADQDQDAKQDAKGGPEGGKDKKQSDAGLKDIGGGLKIKDVKVGNGKQAKAGKTILMRYIGKFTDGKVFDSNTKGKPFSFRLGGGDVIQGWDRGVTGMQVGGERLLIVPPALAYGSKPPEGIPPNATLRFELKLLDVK